jgi:DNA-binding NarL/FixJ family response regulator
VIGRDVEVLALVGEGCSHTEIAKRLVIGKKTALVHLVAVMAKVATEDRVETPLVVVRKGLVPPTG